MKTLDQYSIEELNQALKRKGEEPSPIPNIKREIELISCLKELPKQDIKVIVFDVQLMEVKEVSTGETDLNGAWKSNRKNWSYWSHFPKIIPGENNEQSSESKNSN